MSEVFVGPLDRFDISLTNALQGNLSGAGRALIAPDTLAPVERQRAIERFFGVSEPGPMKELLALTTNPTVLLGGILSLKYPINPSRMYLSQNKQFEEGLRRLIPVYDHIADFNEIYRGTPIPSLFSDLGGRMHSFHKQGNDLLGRATQAYLDLHGSLPTAESESRVVYEMLRRSGDATEMLTNQAKRLAQAGRTDLSGKLERMANALPRVQLTPAEEALREGWSGYLDWAYQTKGATETKGIAESLARKTGGTKPLGQYREGYFPLVTKRTSMESKAVEEAFARKVLTEGQKVSGLKIQGPLQSTLTPSQLAEALSDFTADTKGRFVPNTDEFWGAFQEHLVKQMPTGAAGKVAAGHNIARFNRMIPEIDGLRRVGLDDLANLLEESKTTYEQWAINQPFADVGGPVVRVREARLDGTPTLGVYNQQAARDYAWSVRPDGWDKSVGERINEVTRELATGNRVDSKTGEVVAVAVPKKGVRLAPFAGTAEGAEPLRASMLRETFIPGALGISTYDEITQSAWWDSARVAAGDLLATERGGKLGAALDAAGLGKVKNALYESILRSPAMEYKQAMAGVSSLFYQSTLGLPNVVAPVKNLFQTFTTTVPRVGWKHTINGTKTTFKEMGEYIKLRFGEQALTHEEAFVKAFPGFRETGLAMEEGLLKAMGQVYASNGAVSPIGTAWQKFQKASMSLFTGSEMFNRLNAYNAGKSVMSEVLHKVAQTGEEVLDYATGVYTKLPKSAAAIEASPVYQRLLHAGASGVLMDTQFGGGPLGTPLALLKLPAPLRQLANFPLRFLNMMTHGGDLEGFLGQAGRALVVAGVAGSILASVLGPSGKKLAQDATLFGALPAPSEMGPFAPLPLVPPILQLAGSGAQALMGDPTNLQKSLPLLVPGGVGLGRVSSLMGSKDIASLLRRPYVDYSRITPDGRFPMLSPDGNLEGFYTGGQLFGKAIGLGDINGEQEQVLTQWMQKYGERLSSMRKDYLDALATNDMRTADKINSEYQRLNPGMGDIPVKPSHLQAIESRRNASRLERVLEMMPVEARQQFAAVSSVAFAQSGPAFLGIEPSVLVSQPTIRSREPYRLQPPAPQPQINAGAANRINWMFNNSNLEQQ